MPPEASPAFVTRRTALGGALALASAGAALAAPNGAVAAIERRVGGRVGLAAIDSTGRARIAYRADERFPMCSTFKALLAAAVLARVDARRERLDRLIPYRKADLLDYAPATTANLGKGGMSVSDLCAAAVEQSDNTAANLLLKTVGGPAGYTAFARRIGDRVTRLDRNEPALNTALPGDPRDTTTPAAMAESLRRVLLGPVLQPASRARLTAWLTTNQTGDRRLKAGLPAGWSIGDKTGTGDRGSTNDIAIIWTRQHNSVLVAAYLTGSAAPRAELEAALADLGRLVANAFTPVLISHG